jgi:hypothetical protein
MNIAVVEQRLQLTEKRDGFLKRAFSLSGVKSTVNITEGDNAKIKCNARV